MRANYSHTRSGNVILLAVLMLATGIVGGITVALIVVSQLRQAKSLDSGLVAYYNAEAGLEESLYNVRQAGYCTTNACNDVAGYVPQTLPPHSTSSTTCTGNTGPGCAAQTYDRQIIPPNLVPTPDLSENETFQLDLDPTHAVQQLQVLWSPAGGTLPQLEVSYVVSTLGGTKVCRPNAGVPYACALQSPSGVCYPGGASAAPLLLDLSSGGGSNDCPISPTFQQIRFKALAADIKALTLQVIAPPSGTLDNYLEVHSRRTYSGVTQALQTTVPKSVPAFGFPDYVIFSEQDISK